MSEAYLETTERDPLMTTMMSEASYLDGFEYVPGRFLKLPSRLPDAGDDYWYLNCVEKCKNLIVARS